MKKIIKKICLFIGKILRFIDRIIITPIMKLFLKISELFSKNNKTFEKLFTNKQSLIVISLLLAFLVFYFVDQNSSALVDNSAEILYSQPVTAIYNEEAYVVEGLPETVDVVLIGRQSDIYLAKQYPSQEISVDLRELSAGTHKVSLKYRQAISSVDYKIDPSQVTVIIYDKVSSTREVTAEVLHRNNLDSKLDISSISLSQTEVTIKGSAKKLETVAYVKALIDVNNLVEPTVGEASISNNKLVAYNDAGEIVDVEILPETVDATLNITSVSKVVPIRVVPVGDIALGYAIESTTTNISNVTIYGDEESLKEIEYIPVRIDITNLSAYKEFTVNLEKPSGVREMSEKTVTVKVNVGAEEQKEVSGIGIQTINLAEGLKVTALNEENSTVSVIVRGSKELLDDLDTSTITATIDLSEYTSMVKSSSEKEFIVENPLYNKIFEDNSVDIFNNNFYVKDVGFNYWTKGNKKQRDGKSVGKRILYTGNKENVEDIPFLKGRDVFKYKINTPKNYLRCNYKDLLTPSDTFRYSVEFLRISPKIVYRQTANQIIAALDCNSNYLDKTVHLVVPKENVNIDLNYVLGLMNSSLYNFLYTHISQEAEGKAFSQVKTVFIKKLPIKLNADQNYINLIVQFVRRIIEIVNSSDFEISIKKQQAVKEYENQIDILVYKLYNLTYDEILVIDQNFSMSEEEYSNYVI